MDWKNYGDMDPRQGAFLVRNPSLDRNGDFTAECIETVCENNVGGDESRFMIRQGNIFLSAKNFASALDVIGSKLEDGVIVTPGHYGEDLFEKVNSEQGLAFLAGAAHAYAGIDDVEISALVQIGKDEVYDMDRKFEGDLNIYSKNSSLWAIMERELDGFTRPEGAGGAWFVRTVEQETSPSPGW